MKGTLKIDDIAKVKATAITATFKDFNGDAEEWRKAYFDLLSWKNTWGTPLLMDINSTREGKPFLDMVVRESDKDHVVDYLDGLGYRNIKTAPVTSLIVRPEWDENIDFVFIDY